MRNKCNLLNDLSCEINVYNLELRCPYLINKEDLFSYNPGMCRVFIIALHVEQFAVHPTPGFAVQPVNDSILADGKY